MNIFGDQTIKAGDLAMVVRDCCGAYLGQPLKVASVFNIPHPGEALCTKCQRSYSNISVVEVEDPGELLYAPLFWLMKIDPPQVSATVEQDERIAA